MFWQKQLSCLAGSPSINWLSPQKRIKTPEETSEPPRAVEQVAQLTDEMSVEAQRATAGVPCRQLVPAKKYFDALVKGAKPSGLAFPVCPANLPSFLLPAEWPLCEAACEEAQAQLKHALNELDQSWMKGYLLGQEKKVVQNLLCDGLTQVQQVHQAAFELARHPTSANWQSLQQALSKLTEISTTAMQPPDTQATETALPTASLGWITRIWDEIQYFLAPVVMTGWGILVKFGVLAAEITQNIPLIGGLICAICDHTTTYCGSDRST